MAPSLKTGSTIKVSGLLLPSIRIVRSSLMAVFSVAKACSTAALTAGLSVFCSKLNRFRLATPGEGSR